MVLSIRSNDLSARANRMDQGARRVDFASDRVCLARNGARADTNWVPCATVSVVTDAARVTASGDRLGGTPERSQPDPASTRCHAAVIRSKTVEITLNQAAVKKSN